MLLMSAGLSHCACTLPLSRALSSCTYLVAYMVAYMIAHPVLCCVTAGMFVTVFVVCRLRRPTYAHTDHKQWQGVIIMGQAVHTWLHCQRHACRE